MHLRPPLRIFIAYTEAGGGHLAPAQALAQVLQREPGVQVTLLSLYREFAADLEWSPRLFGRSAETIYNEFILGTRWGRLLWPAFAGLMMLNVRAVQREAAARLAAHWDMRRPDLVVSVMPLVNGLLAHSLQQAGSPAPLATVMTDFVEPAPGAWITGGAQWLACGTEDAARQALRRGVPPARLLASDGMVVRPQFAGAAAQELEAGPARLRLGLDPACATAVVMLGGHASSAMLDVAQALSALGGRLQVVFLCGRNAALAEALAQLHTPYRKVALGFVDDAAAHLACADFVIGKPGAGLVAESLALGLPMIVEYNLWTLAQERHNARWAVQAGVAIAVRRYGDVADAAARLLLPDAPQRRRAAAWRGRNRSAERVADWLLNLACAARRDAAGPDDVWQPSVRLRA